MRGAFALLALCMSAPVLDGEVRADPGEPVAPGQRGEVSLTILDTPVREAPLVVWLQGGEVSIPDNRLGWADVVDPRAEQPRLRARVVAPAEPGSYVLEGWVLYLTCDEDRCRPRNADVEWTVVVSSP